MPDIHPPGRFPFFPPGKEAISFLDKTRGFWKILIFALISLGGIKQATAETFSIELMTGTAYNLPTGLSIHQAGQPDLNFTANYDTNPFGEDAPYYAYRFSLWSGDEAWELEHIHHKMFLSNPLPEIGEFMMCHGFNYFFIGHAWKRSGLIFHLGAGPIVTHPEAEIRGLKYDSEHGGLFDAGYYFSGIGAQATLGKNFYFSKNFYALLETTVTAGWAWWVPIPNGSADASNLALHGHFGMGVDL